MRDEICFNFLKHDLHQLEVQKLQKKISSHFGNPEIVFFFICKQNN